MVDFNKLLGKRELTKPIDPIAIFEYLDKETGKEEIRKAEEHVLKEWNTNFRDQKDIIVKLPTGQGKTLIGLLMLQSLINEGKGPAIYLCPNNYLVNQTVDQARSFGIETVQFPPDSTQPPREFRNSEAILVANCKRLFNGKSVFGVTGSSRETICLGSVVMDDAHKCLDIIRESFSIQIERENSEGNRNPIYDELFTIFKESLRRQAPGTFAEIYGGQDIFMEVPFWSWYDRNKDVLNVLTKYRETKELLFVWDLLKNKIEYCTCIFSGTKLEIAPRLLPLELIPSFYEAPRRIFLSATLTDDAFLIRDLGIKSESVSNPLTFDKVKYSGERLILIPTLLTQSLKREYIISWLSYFARKHGNFGIVSIVPSSNHARDWKNAVITNVKTLYKSIDELKTKIKQNDAKHILVLLNQYDGVDLPDSTCRILCLDSLPSYSSLTDRNAQSTRPGTSVLLRAQAQRIEQGIGRAIRGSSDWCIVIIIGNNLTDFLSENPKRIYFSNEVQMQIKIGEELASEMMTEGKSLDAIETLINQCLNRDTGWKEYYRTQMSNVETKPIKKEYIERALMERNAEILFQQKLFTQAIKEVQNLIAIAASDHRDKGWYLQLKAIYQYPTAPSQSMDTQLKAYTENDRLFRPETGITYTKLLANDINRTSIIIDFIRKHESHNSLIMNVINTLDKITFGVSSDSFEEGIDELGEILGFAKQRPEKITGSGPDNLWHIKGKEYWVIECKNMVIADRGISKGEAGQMNTSIAWFKKYYEGSLGNPIFIHKADVLESDAFGTEPFWVLQPEKIENLKKDIINFYNSLKEFSFDVISSAIISGKLKEHHLEIDDIKTKFLTRVTDNEMKQ